MSLCVVDLSLFNDTDYKDIPNKLTAEIGNLGNVKKNSLLNYKQAVDQRDFNQTSRLKCELKYIS